MFGITIDELEILSKAVDPKDLKAFITHSKVMNDKNAKMPARVKAAEEVFRLGLAHSKANPKEPPLKALAADFTPELEAPVAPAPVVAEPKIDPPTGAAQAGPVVNVPTPAEVPFHEEFARHHGGDPKAIKATFDAMTPEHLATTKAWHAEQLQNKMQKSVETLYTLFQTLKKQL
jgi:hypothetical protein